ncbi:MAG: hypothetical protein O2968_14305 [Acidobacteria bacterium]|nr:hypothetical protein [Acidobacteriota bacterium]
MPMKKTSRRGFGKTLAACTASAGMASTALAQEKQADPEAAPPCTINPALGEFDLPRSAEPAFTFKA